MNRTVEEARSWLGVRWLHQGRSRDGVDCAGLVIEVAKATQGSTFDIVNYERVATDETMLSLCNTYMEPVPVSAILPGDVLVLRFENQRHMGIVGDYLYGGHSLIHAHLPSRKVVEVRMDSNWRHRIMRAYRFKGGV